jgi:hypothetical protein
MSEQRDAYEAESRGVARLLATGVFHGEAVHERWWVQWLQRLISARGRITENPYNPVAEPMRHYPAVMCLWAMGIGTILAGHEKLLARLLNEPKWKPVYGNQQPQPAVRCLNPRGV